MAIKIVMVEDDLQLADLLTQYLSKFNIKVTNYDDPFMALSAMSVEKYDLLILDLTLPGLDGIEVCKEVVKKHKLPIIISSARSDIADKVTTLELGADDYLPKPYDPRELEARIKTILRRYNKTNQDTNFSKDTVFVYNKKKQSITKNNQYIKFTQAEYEIMGLLIQRKGFVVSRYDILENCDFAKDNEHNGSIAVIINRIRSKIEDDTKQPMHLLTIRGMGYKLV